MPTINPQAVRGPVTAIPVVAGTGVRFVEDVPNNRIVAEVDETVLYDSHDNTGTNADIVLSETANNFKSIKVLYRINDGVYSCTEVKPDTSGSIRVGMAAGSSVVATASTGSDLTTALETPGLFYILKVVGINRVASA